jgi:hypothetical protein
LRSNAEAIVETVIPAPLAETVMLPGWTSGLVPVDEPLDDAEPVDEPLPGRPVEAGVSAAPPELAPEPVGAVDGPVGETPPGDAARPAASAGVAAPSVPSAAVAPRIVAWVRA